jgi:hypothetical protein
MKSWRAEPSSWLILGIADEDQMILYRLQVYTCVYTYTARLPCDAWPQRMTPHILQIVASYRMIMQKRRLMLPRPHIDGNFNFGTRVVREHAPAVKFP